jgi:hypothetical protein
MKIAKHIPKHLKLIHRPWIIWSLASLSWITGCCSLVFLSYPGSELVILSLLAFSLVLMSLYPIVICDLSKPLETITIRQYGLLGRNLAEYPFQMILAIELIEGRDKSGGIFYKIRLVAKYKLIYLTAAPIEDAQQARAIALLLSEFMEVPLSYVPGRTSMLQYPQD